MEIREKIIEAADQLFMQYGIRSVTMDDIANHLSISKKTIYQYFKDKSEIVETVTNGHIEKNKNFFESLPEKASSAIEELFMISKWMRQEILNLNPSLLYDLRKFHHRAWDTYQKFKEDFCLDCIIQTLHRGKKDGHFREDINPKILAILRMEQVEMSFNTEVFPASEFDFKEVQMQLFDHFIKGIITNKGLELLNQYLNNSQKK